MFSRGISWKPFEKIIVHLILIAVFLFTLRLTCLSSALPPRRRGGNIRQGSPVQEERTAEEKERRQEERQRGETRQSKEAQEDCKFVQLSHSGFVTFAVSS